MSRTDALNALEMSRVALWSMYNNNTSPPTSVNTTSPPNHEPQREALNLAESPVHSIKRERENDYVDREEREYGLPPSKKSSQSSIQQLHTQLQQSHLSSSHNHYKIDHRRRSSTPISPEHHNNRSDRERERESRHHINSSRRHLSASPPSHRNGVNSSQNGTGDLLNGCSPITLLSGMQFKLSSRGKILIKIITLIN